jgi:hypothetical protein
MYRDNSKELVEFETPSKRNIICSIFGHKKKLKTTEERSRNLNVFFVETHNEKQLKFSVTTVIENCHFAFANKICERCSAIFPVDRILNLRQKKLENWAYLSLSYLEDNNTFSFASWVGVIKNKDVYRDIYCPPSQTKIISSMSDYYDLVNKRPLLPIKKRFGNEWRRAKLASEETILYNIATHEMRLL